MHIFKCIRLTVFNQGKGSYFALSIIARSSKKSGKIITLLKGKPSQKKCNLCYAWGGGQKSVFITLFKNMV